MGSLLASLAMKRFGSIEFDGEIDGLGRLPGFGKASRFDPFDLHPAEAAGKRGLHPIDIDFLGSMWKLGLQERLHK